MKFFHYWRSSCSWRVRWALKVKDISIDSQHINLLQDEQKNASYLEINPSGFVPAFEIAGQTFSESIALLEWLEETYPRPTLLPKDPISRLRVRQLVQIIASGIQPLQNLFLLNYLAGHGLDKEAFAKLVIEKGLSAYEKIALHSSGTYSIGGELTIADLCLVPQCYNAERFSVNMDQFPICQRIYQNCLKRNDCGSTSPDATKVK